MSWVASKGAWPCTTAMDGGAVISGLRIDDKTTQNCFHTPALISCQQLKRLCPLVLRKQKQHCFRPKRINESTLTEAHRAAATPRLSPQPYCSIDQRCIHCCCRMPCRVACRIVRSQSTRHHSPYPSHTHSRAGRKVRLVACDSNSSAQTRRLHRRRSFPQRRCLERSARGKSPSCLPPACLSQRSVPSANHSHLASTPLQHPLDADWLAPPVRPCAMAKTASKHGSGSPPEQRRTWSGRGQSRRSSAVCGAPHPFHDTRMPLSEVVAW